MWISRRVVMIVGAVSLLLNVFLVGIIAGHLWDARKGRAAGPAQGGPLVRPNALSPVDRRMFAAGMAPHRPDLRAARQAHRAARLAIEADIAAPTYDRAKVTEDFAALRQTNRTVDEVTDSALIDALANLSEEARATIVHGRRAPPPR